MKVKTYANIVIALSEAQLAFVYAYSSVQPWVKTLLIGLMLFGVVLAVAVNTILREAPY